MKDYRFVTVSQINEYLKTVLSSDENLTGLFIKGEISNFTHHLKSGHFYFTLKDEKSSIKAVMFRGSARYVRFRPENGMKVIVFGSVRVFERDGVYQIYCEDMQPDGVGALYLAFEQMKRELEGLGYFSPERKRPIPEIPGKITLVTAPTGAALQDLRNILSRRYPVVKVDLIPILVQGEQAPASIERAFQYLNAREDSFTDVVILARGGGSAEDLAAFNTRQVADALYHCKFPVISAVGHETDFTIADFVADLRAPTPSAAAELAVPDKKALTDALDNYRNLMYNYTLSALQAAEKEAALLSNKIRILSPGKVLERHREELIKAEKTMYLSQQAHLERRQKDLMSVVKVLDALSPLNVLTRGYSITFADGRAVKDSAEVSVGEQIETRLGRGRLISEVTKIDTEE